MMSQDDVANIDRMIEASNKENEEICRKIVEARKAAQKAYRNNSSKKGVIQCMIKSIVKNT